MALTSFRISGIDDGKHVLDPTSILNECCDLRSTCRFQLVHNGSPFRAIFLGMRPNGIELDIPTEGRAERLQTEAICCVSFPFRTSLCAFLGCLVDVQTQISGERRVITTIPKQLTITNLRRSFRVPVIQHAGFEATIRLADSRLLSVNVCDVTEAGINVEFSADDHPNLSVGIAVGVEVRFRGELIQKKGEVSRLSGSHCIIVFASPMFEEDRREEDRWRETVSSLQKLWLKSRIE